MTMEEEVEELCRITVARTPIIRPVMGFCSNSLSWKTLPAAQHAHVHQYFRSHYSLYTISQHTMASAHNTVCVCVCVVSNV